MRSELEVYEVRIRSSKTVHVYQMLRHELRYVVHTVEKRKTPIVAYEQFSVIVSDLISNESVRWLFFCFML